jgi:dTDP-4-amino-4,6-dideoxygalactose transaminase
MIPLVKTYLPEKDVLMPALEKVLYSGYIAQGEQVDLFEKSFTEYIGSGFSVSLNSGTAALHIALILAGVKENDEVISTALTAEPTNVSIKMVGAKIRYADIDLETGSIDPNSILKKINNKTKAILVVDYAGIPVDVERIRNISLKYNLPVIHDAAHSLGATFNGLKSGSHFDYTVFSLQAIKHMTTIDGGILHLRRKDDYDKAKLIRWFGLDKSQSRLDNNIKLQGYKYHMNNVNATIGLLQLKNIDEVVGVYIQNGKYFDESLKGIHGVELLTYYDRTIPSYWLYTLKVERRDQFVKKLGSYGIMASELHKRNDAHQYLNDFQESLPCLDIFYAKMVHIPCGWWIGDEERVKIVSAIKGGW